MKPSEFGCFFTLQNEPAVGSRLEMEIVIPPEILGYEVGTIRCLGEVVRVDKQVPSGATGDAKTGVACSIEKYQLVPVNDIDGELPAEK